jgi:hypothetical protein
MIRQLSQPDRARQINAEFGETFAATRGTLPFDVA